MSRARLLPLALVGALASVVLVAAPTQAASVTLQGSVRYTSGAPVVNVLVGVRDPRGSQPQYVAYTDAQGRYSIDTPGLDTAQLRVAFSPGGILNQLVDSEPFGLEEPRTENLVVPVKAILRPKVVLGAGGSPVAEAEVRAFGPAATTTSSGGLALVTTIPDAECDTTVGGTCDLEVLAGGSVSGLEVTPRSGYRTAFDGVTTPGALTTTTLVLPADHLVSGTLLYGDDGTPIAGATVSLADIRGTASTATTTAADGTYSLRLPPGEVRLRILGTADRLGFEAQFDFVSGVFDLDRPRTIPLNLPIIGRLQVLVRDAVDQPVSGARVDLSDTVSRYEGETEDGIPITVRLAPGGVGLPKVSCPSTDSTGACEFPVFMSGAVSGFDVVHPVAGGKFVAGSSPEPGYVRTVYARYSRYASAESSGQTEGRVALTIPAWGTIAALTTTQFEGPEDVEAPFGRIDYRVTVSGDNELPQISFRLPPGATPNAMLRVTDQGLADIGDDISYANGVWKLRVVDGGPGDEDGSQNGFVTGNLVPAVLDQLSVTTDLLPGVPKGKPYSAQLSATGWGAPYTWSLHADSVALPAGLTLSADGVISGTTSVLGSPQILVEVRNRHGAARTKLLRLSVSTIVVTTRELPTSYFGKTYSVALKAIGASFPNWQVATGSLPPGFTLARNGTLSGTPTVAGTYTFRVNVASAGLISPPQELTLVVRPMEVATTSLPDAPVAGLYSQKLTANGGKGTLVWSVVGGALPTGVTLNSAGTVSGRPTTVGTYTVTVKVADGSTPKLTATRTLMITVTPMQIATASLPSGKKGGFYTVTLVAVGGKATLAWSLASGTLPTGLTLSAAGKITGYPKAPGTWAFTVRVTDASVPKNVAVRTLTLTVV